MTDSTPLVTVTRNPESVAVKVPGREPRVFWREQRDVARRLCAELDVALRALGWE